MGQLSRRVGLDFLHWLAPLPGLDWLDVGCGNGAFTEVIQSHAAPNRIAGLDPSEAQITYARARPGASRARFHRGDAMALPWTGAEFDMTVMALALAFLPDPARGLAEMIRVTRPGGWIATYMWDLPRGLPLFRALGRLGHPASMPPAAQVAARAPMLALWQGAGPGDVAATALPLPLRFADFASYWDWIASPAGPQAETLARLDAPALDRLKADLDASLPRDSSGAIAYTALAQAVRGRKPG